jgi:hypothetical protein
MERKSSEEKPWKEDAMSRNARAREHMAEETVHVAHAACPQGTVAMCMCEV